MKTRKRIFIGIGIVQCILGTIFSLSFPSATSDLSSFEENLKKHNGDQIEQFVDVPSEEEKESLRSLFEHTLEPMSDTAHRINRMKHRGSESLIFFGLITLSLALSIPIKQGSESIDQRNG